MFYRIERTINKMFDEALKRASIGLLQLSLQVVVFYCESFDASMPGAMPHLAVFIRRTLKVMIGEHHPLALPFLGADWVL